ncbi:MAG: sulfite exporter TauE/SafE family protein [Spirochaetales bacterium]|nr:sulfite exporter TauE/SafE family protein [Spirochaetales bacterium]
MAGITGGLFGIGGGTVIVPALLFILTLPLQESQAISLAALILPVGFFGALKYHKAGHLSIKAASLIALGLLLATPIGTFVNLSLNKLALDISYGVFLLYIAYRFIQPVDLVTSLHQRRMKRKLGDSYQPKLKQKKEKRLVDHWALILAIGLTAGISSGLFGIGGGAIIVPSLVFICGFQYKSAVAASLAAMVPPVSISGVIMHYQNGTMNLLYSLPIALGILLGEFIGSHIGLNLNSKITKRLYGVFLIGTAFYVMLT